MAIRKTVSWVGHRVREALVHLDRWSQPSRSIRVCFLPWGVPEGDSTELRVVNIAQKLRKQGWRCVVIPAQLELGQRQRIVRREKPDVLFMQKSRHPANRPRFYDGCPVVYDIDDADFLDPNLTEAVAECCQGSLAVIAGSDYVAKWCKPYCQNVEVVWTGTPESTAKPTIPSRNRLRVVAWAPSSAKDQVADQEIVADTLIGLKSLRIPFQFRCYGVNDTASIASFLDRLREAGVDVTTIPKMPYRQFLESLDEVAVGLAPFSWDMPFNRGKSFGKVLAYLARNVAIVASPVVEHPKFFRHEKNGMLPDSSADWVNSVAKLLVDPELRQSITDCATVDFLNNLTTTVAAARVKKVIENVIENGTRIS